MAAPFMDDGHVHVVTARGKFVITPSTMFCVYLDGDRIHGGLTTDAMQTIMHHLGQQDETLEVGIRVNGHFGETEQCGARFNPVAHYSEKSSNRSGGPYKLILAAWQGDVGRGGALWVAGVTRYLDPQKPETWGKQPFRYEGPSMSYVENLDAERLSAAFTRYCIEQKSGDT